MVSELDQLVEDLRNHYKHEGHKAKFSLYNSPMYPMISGTVPINELWLPTQYHYDQECNEIVDKGDILCVSYDYDPSL